MSDFLIGAGCCLFAANLVMGGWLLTQGEWAMGVVNVTLAVMVLWQVTEHIFEDDDA